MCGHIFIYPQEERVKVVDVSVMNKICSGKFYNDDRKLISVSYLYSYNLKHAFSLIINNACSFLAAEHPTLRLCYRCFSPVRKSLGAVSKSHKLNKLKCDWI